jgi:hypothetical protein
MFLNDKDMRMFKQMIFAGLVVLLCGAFALGAWVF